MTVTSLIEPVGGGNVAGVDPLKRALTVTVRYERGGALGTRSFKVSGEGTWALELLDQTATDVADYDRRDKRATDAIAALVGAAGSTLDELVGLSTKSAAEVVTTGGLGQGFGPSSRHSTRESDLLREEFFEPNRPRRSTRSEI